MAPIHRLEQGCAEIKGPLLAILPFLHALGSHETLSLLFIQNNLNALDGGLVIRNQQILKRIDAALGLFQFRDTRGGYSASRIAEPTRSRVIAATPPVPPPSTQDVSVWLLYAGDGERVALERPVYGDVLAGAGNDLVLIGDFVDFPVFGHQDCR